MKIYALGLAALLCTTPVSAEDLQRVEFMHYWVSPGESAAVNVIASEVRSRGASWTESTSQDYLKMRLNAVQRTVGGFSPSAVLVLGGKDAQTLSELEIIEPTTSFAEKYDWQNTVHTIALNAASGGNNDYWVVPISIHNENSAWFNSGIYESLDLQLPGDWNAFLEQAEIIKEAGYIPLAAGNQGWQLRILFMPVVAGVAGSEVFEQAFIKGDASALQMPEMTAALETFAKLRGYSSGSLVDGWSEAVGLVAEGKAAMSVMGDWAKGDLLAKGLSPDSDFKCTAAPGSDGIFLADVDMLALPIGKEQGVTEEQELMVDVVLSEPVQVNFARHKGSTPVKKDIDPSALDICAKQNFEILSGNGEVFISPRVALEEAQIVGIQGAIFKFWNDPSMDTDQFRALLDEALNT